MAIGPLNIDLPQIPQLDMGAYLPEAIVKARRVPLQPNQPRAVSALQTKYAPDGYLTQLINSGEFAPHAVNALRQYDQDRVARGQAPLSEKETTAALTAATTKQAVTEPAKRGIFNIPGNLIKDAGDILKSLPQLPGALINEVRSLPDIGQHIAEAKNPLVGLASAPGIRMLPGAFIAEQLAGGTPGELARHPLFTALDVLPIANQAAKGTAVAARAAEQAADFARLGGDARLGIASQRLARRPLKTALTKTLDEDGNLINNRVGELREVVRNTKAGQYARQVWGQESRDAMMAVQIGAQNVRNIFGGTLDVADNTLAPFAREAGQFQTKLADMGLADRMPEMVDNLQQSNWNVDAPMREGMEMTRDFQGRVATALAEENLLKIFDGEVYDLDTGLKLQKRQHRLDFTRSMVQKRGELEMRLVDDAVHSRLHEMVRDPKLGPGVKDILFGLQNRKWTVVTKGIEQLRRTDAFTDKDFIKRIREMRDIGKEIDRKYSNFTDRKLAKEQKRFDEVTAEAVPSRFLPELERRTRIAAKNKAININTVDQAAEINRLADQGLWERIPNFTEKMYRDVQYEAARTWKQWRDEGFDPVYVHTVTPNKAMAAIHPYASIVPRTASAVKKRAWDMAPGVKNVSVAVTHQMMEFISHQQIELSIKSIMDQMGETQLSLRERFAPAARRRLERDPVLDFDGHLQNLIEERYTKFDPDTEGYAWGSPYLSKLKQDKIYIPKPVAKNMKLIADPKRLMGGLLDPVTNVFRAATVSLSLRTQVYNLLGGAISIEGNRPGALIRSAAKARELMRNPEYVPDALKPFVGSTKDQLMDLNREALGAFNEGVWAHLRTNSLKRLWGEQQAAKKVGSPITRFKEKFTGLMEKSYDLNSKVDDFYRMTAFIDTYDGAVKAGSNVADAERKAITAVRENMQDYLSMTPIERSVIRSIIPFYGFMGHAMRFVLRYPFDHPLRTEMMTKLAVAEMEDQQHLPTRFMSMLFMGGLGPNGEQTAINAGPFNPFGDIANFATVKGLAGGTNPLIQTMLQAIGIENGEAELYPSLRYDPATGRLAARGSNPITNILHNTLPQAQVITAMLGVNEEYKDMVRRDPAAASRYLASGLTIPMAWRQINVDQEIMKAELARQDAQTKVKNEALKSGNWSEALMYPSLAEYLDAIEQLTPEQRLPFNQLTPEQIQGITMQTPQQLPDFANVQPLDMTINSLLDANKQGRILPGSSLQNTTGGT